MGNIIGNIANVSREPIAVSLANNPNYVEFRSIQNSTPNRLLDISLRVLGGTNQAVSIITIVESYSGYRHEFRGTTTESEVSSRTFFLNEDVSITAENIRRCLMLDDFFRMNYQITVPEGGDTIRIASIGSGIRYAFYFEEINSQFISVTGNPENTTNNDSIDAGIGNCEIELDVYKSTGVFLGKTDTSLGNYMTTLRKSYDGIPVWFDINAATRSASSLSDSFLNGAGWVDMGTISDFRFTAYRYDGINRQPIYSSDIIYTTNGYDRNLADNNLSDYVYDTRLDNIVKPLTKQPVLFHVKGQTQYFNFILSDPDRNITSGSLEITYKLYTQSGKLITSIDAHSKDKNLFNVGNVIKLDIDGQISAYANTGIVKVCLSRSGNQISEPIVFRILPECLYKVNDFAFLNSLGGWSSFNFAGQDSSAFDTEANTIYKTQTPDYKISSEIESIYRKEVTENFTVTTMPINREVCDWLKELSSSVAVYELKTNRYVIVDELNISSNSKDDLFIIEMKYRYSDRYNASINGSN